LDGKSVILFCRRSGFKVSRNQSFKNLFGENLLVHVS
jgi:hypothetical protein